ncbi:hypothetical protein ABBQ38_005403 [Trebouxia sp. C0009 RCD-2024]
MQLSSAFLGSKLTLRAASAPHVNPQAPRQVTCMAKKKGVRCIVTLECTEARGLGQTPSRYTTQKNRKNTTGRMELKKYNKYLKRVTVHKEIK